MNEDFGAGRCHGGLVEVEGTIHMGFGGELRVGVGAAKEVEGCGRLAYQAIPQVQRKRWVGTGEAGEKMVFPRADSLFSWVGTVIMGSHQLVRDFFLVHECF